MPRSNGLEENCLWTRKALHPLCTEVERLSDNLNIDTSFLASLTCKGLRWVLARLDVAANGKPHL